ncbi:MAG: thioesterase [Balneolaceae bacterium]|nr:thioesterase [Balneolaceae bacterium]
MEKQIFTQSFAIRSSEVRPSGNAKLQTICDLLQEVAGNHALELNWDVTQLKEHNLTWFLHRLDLEIEKYPRWRENVTVQTWPSGSDRLRAYRDFLILDDNEEVLVRALSYWLMINLESRRPSRMPKEVLEISPKNTDHVLPLKDDRPQFPENIFDKKQFAVRYSDLDINEHVNNIKYVEWITETLPVQHQIKAFDIEFKAECGYGSKVKITTGATEKGDIGAVVKQTENEKIMATAEMIVDNA